MYPTAGKKAEKSHALNEKLAQTLREAEEKLRLTRLRVDTKKKLVEYKKQEMRTVAEIEEKIKDCRNGNGML